MLDVSECIYLYRPFALNVVLYPFQTFCVFLLSDCLVDLRAQLLGPLQSFLQGPMVVMIIWGVLEDLRNRRRRLPQKAKEKGEI